MAAASLNLTNGAQLGHLPSERPLVASLRALNGQGCGPRQLCDGLPCAGAGGATRTSPCGERDDGGRAGAVPPAGLRARGGGPHREGGREG